MQSFWPIHEGAYFSRSRLGKGFAKLPSLATILLVLLPLSTLAGCSKPSNQAELSVQLATPTPGWEDDRQRDAQIDQIYGAAKLHDTVRLETLRGTAVHNGTPLDPAVALALYIVDSQKYAADFVAAYPTDHIGVQFDYGPRLDRANVAPGGYIFPIHALGMIAASGDPAAMAKLFLASTVAEDRIADAYGQEVVHAANRAPQVALTALGTLPPAAQLSVAGLPAWCTVRIRLLDSTAATPSEQNAQVKLRAKQADCAGTH